MAVFVGLLLAAQVQVTMPTRPDCPASADVARDIETLIGDPVPPIDVRLTVRDTEAGVVAQLVYVAGGQTQTRDIPGASCAEVVNAAAVVVAVGVDPIAVQKTLEPVLQRPTVVAPVVVEPPPALPLTSEPEPEAPAPATVVEGAQPRPEPQAARRSRPSLGAFVRGGIGAGGLPDPMGWVGGGLQLGFGGLRVELAGQHLFAQRLEHPDNSSTGADVSMTSARPAVCWTPRVGAFTLGGCAGLDLGLARGAAFGLDRGGTGRALWVAVTPGLRAHWHPTRRFFLGLAVDVPISVARPTLTIDDFTAPLVETGLAAVWAGLSVGFTFFDESRPNRR